ncbi:MAG: glycerophosphodiester phosphodiesterase family protein [Bacteroidota bacterium]
MKVPLALHILSKIAFVLLLVACHKKVGLENIAVIGHAGNGMAIASNLFHDNSQEALELALNTEGCSGVEFDVRISKDSVLWLFHDEQLDQQTNLEGSIGNLTSAELENGHYTSLHQEKLVRLDQFSFQNWSGKTLFFDLKPSVVGDAIQSTPALFVDLIDQLNVGVNNNVRCIVPSKSWYNNLPVSAYIDYLMYIPSSEDFDFYISNYSNLCIGFVMRNSAVSKEHVQQVKNLDRQLYLFDMRSPKGIRTALKKYPTGVITDDIKATLIEKY